MVENTPRFIDKSKAVCSASRGPAGIEPAGGVGPSYDTVIEPLATCLARSGGSAKYIPITVGLYIWKRLAVSRLDRAEYEKQPSETENRYTGVLAWA